MRYGEKLQSKGGCSHSWCDSTYNSGLGQTGKIRCHRLPSGRRRIPESEVRRVLNLQEGRRGAIYVRAP
ncbi:MAG: hypothetical protein ACP5KV_05810, partial [Candidatus Methanomethylicaceae archaeon]